MDFPLDFRCPISMELMKDPVTISTGVTYDRKNIEKWLFTCKKKTCPATMQNVENFDITPNHTLMRLILAWQEIESQSRPSGSSSSSPPPPPSSNHDELVSILKTIESTPFKVSSLKKLHSLIINDTGSDHMVKLDFVRSGGVETLIRIIVQILVADTSDFLAFRAAEESLGVLDQLPLDEEGDEETFRLLMSSPESMKSMSIMLQRGSVEARSHALSIYRKMAKANYDWRVFVGIDFFKSLLELASDEMCCTSKASSYALEVMIELLSTRALKKTRLLAIESGAVCTLIELLPDTNSRSKCEKMLVIIKLLCECAEGRLSMAEHGLGIAAVSKKMLRVSETATKTVVKILWLISNSHPTDRVLEEMLIFGSVKKMLALLHTVGDRSSSSTKGKVVKMFKLHGDSWRRCPCFPCELKEFLGFANDSW